VSALVSILIPAFNAEQWIADTIKSALAQTWPEKEIIVVDDGSTDRTLAVARKCSAPNVLIVSQPNQGAAAARNKAYSLSRGDYIQWLDADDLLAPDKISHQIQLLNGLPSKRTLLSAAWGRFRYRFYKAKFIPTLLWADLSPVEWLIRKLQYGVFMQTATWLVSRELSEAAGPWNTEMLSDDDGEYFSRMLIKSDGVRFDPDAKSYYRSLGPDRLSYIGNSNRKLEAMFLSMQLHINYVRLLEDSERVRTACLEYLQTNMLTFYPKRLDIVDQAQQLAADLGGRLEVPQPSWKYRWIQQLFGWTAAKRTQLVYNQAKSSVLRFYDHAAMNWEQRRVAPAESRRA
jgi:glycosyltransferase involved in cell wall biosynthesis